MTKPIKRDTVVKLCNFEGDLSNENGKYGLVRKQLDEGYYRIMQTSGHDRRVSIDNFKILDIDLNTNVENGVVLVFPPSTGKTGTRPIAVPLPDFPHEVSGGGMDPDHQGPGLLLPPDLNNIRMVNGDVLLNKKEMETLKGYKTLLVDAYENPLFAAYSESKMDYDAELAGKLPKGKDSKKEFKNMGRFVKSRYNNMLRQNYCVEQFGWGKPARMQAVDSKEDFDAEVPASVYWYDGSASTGIENTFMGFMRKEGDCIRGAVVFDLSFQKLKIEKFSPFFHRPGGWDFGKVKTLGDFQKYIVDISVNAGEHPSNPYVKNLMSELMSSSGDGDKSAKERIKEKIKQKRMQRQGK